MMSRWSAERSTSARRRRPSPSPCRRPPAPELAFLTAKGSAAEGKPLEKASPEASRLSPGAYRLVPRAWLKKWRRSLAVSGAERPGPPTTSGLPVPSAPLPSNPGAVTAVLKGRSEDHPHHSQATLRLRDRFHRRVAGHPTRSSQIDYAIAFASTETATSRSDGRRARSATTAARRAFA